MSLTGGAGKGQGGRRILGLRGLLTTLALGVLCLPLALGLLVANLVSGGMNENPMTRFAEVGRELRRAVEPDGSGGLRVRRGYQPPAWLSLIVTDKVGLVVYSNLASVTVGSVSKGFLDARSEDSANFSAPYSASPSPGKKPICFYAETVEFRGETLGSYYAIADPIDLRGSDENNAPLYRLFALGLLSLVAVTIGGLASAILARSVMRLERAAGRIASGDLESQVQVRGIREIGALAEAMDRMRATLREDRDRRARFLAAVSHDLRTPLTSIGGYLEAVEDGLADDPETLRRYVEIMHGKARLLEGRIQGLLEFARMETGEWRLGFERLALEPFLSSLCAEFGEDAGLTGRGLAPLLGGSRGIAVLADAALLRRAFENIISNALRYSPPGGLVSLAARRGSSGAAGVGLIIEIDDEGPGIVEADRQRIFEPFYRGSGAREGEGNGLGLYIARSVLRGHGWDIEASSSPTGGARFSVVIPRYSWVERG